MNFPKNAPLESLEGSRVYFSIRVRFVFLAFVVFLFLTLCPNFIKIGHWRF